jgi:hypothetical protein
MKGKTLKRAGGGASTANVPNDPTGKFDANPTPSDVYAGEDSNVLAEAKKRKKGGKVMGEKAMSRCDRAPRKSGGKVGAESSPLTAANKTSNRPGGDIQSKGGMD